MIYLFIGVGDRERPVAASSNAVGKGQNRPVSYPKEMGIGDDATRMVAGGGAGAGIGPGPGSGVNARRRKKASGRVSDAESFGGGPPASSFPSGQHAGGAD